MFTRSDRLRPNTKFSRLSGTESNKSFVDDFDMKRSIVSMRVGLSYDLLRLSSCFGDLYPQSRGHFLQKRLPRTPKQTPTKKIQNTQPKEFISLISHILYKSRFVQAFIPMSISIHIPTITVRNNILLISNHGSYSIIHKSRFAFDECT